MDISDEMLNEFYKKLTAVEESEVPSESELESLFEESKDILHGLRYQKKPDPKKTEAAHDIYRRLCVIAEKNLTGLSTFLGYSEFLSAENMNEEALQYAQKLEALYDSRECDETDSDRQILYSQITMVLKEYKSDDYDTRINYCFKEMDVVRRQIDEADEENEIIHKKELMSVYKKIGAIYFESGEFDKAKAYYLDLFSLIEDIESMDSEAKIEDVASSCNNLSDCYLKEGDEKSALKWLEYSVAKEEKTDLSDFNNFCNLYGAYSALDSFYYDKGEFEKALEYALKTLNIFENKAIYPDCSQYNQSTDAEYLKIVAQIKNLSYMYISRFYVQTATRIAYICNEIKELYEKNNDEKNALIGDEIAIKYLKQAIKIAEKKAFDNPANQPGEIDPDDIVARLELEYYEDDSSLLLTLYKRIIVHYTNFKHPDVLAAPWIDKAIMLSETLVARNPKRFELESAKIYFGAAIMMFKPSERQARRFYFKMCIEKIRNLKYTAPEEYEPLLAMACYNVATIRSDDDTEDIQELLDEAIRLAEKYKDTDKWCKEIADKFSSD